MNNTSFYLNLLGTDSLSITKRLYLLSLLRLVEAALAHLPMSFLPTLKSGRNALLLFMSFTAADGIGLSGGGPRQRSAEAHLCGSGGLRATEPAAGIGPAAAAPPAAANGASEEGLRNGLLRWLQS